MSFAIPSRTQQTQMLSFHSRRRRCLLIIRRKDLLEQSPSERCAGLFRLPVARLRRLPFDIRRNAQQIRLAVRCWLDRSSSPFVNWTLV